MAIGSMIVLQQFHKSYGIFEPFEDVSFEVHSGEIFGLLDPVGAGKTGILETVQNSGAS